MSPPNTPTRDLARTHLRFGWGYLAVSMTLGLTLEALHGFKIGLYLDVSNEARRLLWTLAHAHGALLGLLNIAFAFTLPNADGSRAGAPSLGLTSRCLIAGSLALPLGFFLGGCFAVDGDPGLPIVLAPIGGARAFPGETKTRKPGRSVKINFIQLPSSPSRPRPRPPPRRAPRAAGRPPAPVRGAAGSSPSSMCRRPA